MTAYDELLALDNEFNPLRANFTKSSNTLKQFVGKLPTSCLSVFDHLVGFALKGIMGLQSALWRRIMYIIFRETSL